MEAKEITKALDCFQGTFQYHEHKIINGMKLLITDGCDFIREECKANWLFDAILSFQMKESIKAESFQVWKLKKQDNDTWLLHCEDGNRKIIAVQHIVYSDFKLDEITIWLVDGVVMLPSEY